MGMFDHVACRAMSCPGCGGNLDWQTKDADCVLDTVYVPNVMQGRNEMRMIGGCDDCRWTVEALIRRDHAFTVGQHLQLMAEQKGLVPLIDPVEAEAMGRPERGERTP